VFCRSHFYVACVLLVKSSPGMFLYLCTLAVTRIRYENKFSVFRTSERNLCPVSASWSESLISVGYATI
jgi:hypothetical protein